MVDAGRLRRGIQTRMLSQQKRGNLPADPHRDILPQRARRQVLLAPALEVTRQQSPH